MDEQRNDREIVPFALRRRRQLIRLLEGQHDLAICQYDLATGKVAPWEGLCAACGIPRLCEGTWKDCLAAGELLPESRRQIKEMFRQIHMGTPNGTIQVCARDGEGKRRWFELRYSVLFNEEDRPVSALLSHREITADHEQTLFAMHHLQQIQESEDKRLLFIVSDLTGNWVEQIGGQLIPEGAPSGGMRYNDLGRDILEEYFTFDEKEEAAGYFSAAHLLERYERGERVLRRVWPARIGREEKRCWLESDVTLMPDPYGGHITGFFLFTDETARSEAAMDLKRRSEEDGMTGLLNRAASDSRIKEFLALHPDGRGILILADLDDLKKINDTLGHAQGDKAICTIAAALKQQFRDSDIIARNGGDEFSAFLPGASDNTAIRTNIASLLQKIVTIPIGKEEWRVHCSIGYAEYEPDVGGLEELYRRADLALYHVKRNGKNGYAVYQPEMEQEDYQFRKQAVFSLTNGEKAMQEDAPQLLRAIGSLFPLVLTVDLSTNDYCIMEAGDERFSTLPMAGTVEDIARFYRPWVEPMDWTEVDRALDRERLIRLAAQGEKEVRCHFRIISEGGEEQWAENLSILYVNGDGDICAFHLLRFVPGGGPAPVRPRELTVPQEQPALNDAVLRSVRVLAFELNFNTAVGQLLQSLGEYHRADLAVLYQIDRERNILREFHRWHAREGVGKTGREIPLERAARWLDAFGGGTEICVTSLDDVADGETRKELEAQGIAWGMAVPLHRSDGLIGILDVAGPRRFAGDATMIKATAGFIIEEFRKQHLLATIQDVGDVDRLTGLPSRRKYMQTLGSCLSRPLASAGVFYLDLNGLKALNEQSGSEAGDYVLCQCAAVLIEQGLNAFRLGDDEFIALELDVDRERFQEKEAALRAALEELKPHTVSLGAAWREGTADELTGEKMVDLPALVNEADDLMYAEKQVYYRSAFREGGGLRLGLSSDVLREIREGRFEVYYQPQIDLATGSIYGAEALIRKRDEEGALVSPAVFVPLYESEGVISHVDFYVLDQICADLCRWENELGSTPKISVNFSRVTLMEPGVAERIQEICGKHGTPLSRITVEVTESTGKLSQEQLRELVEGFQRVGLSVALDDFGSRYSNLSVITNIDFQCIKLDKSLTDQLGVDERSTQVVRALIGLCGDVIHTPVLAEGVETREQRDTLRDFACSYAQGYYFSRPVPKSEFTAMLAEGRRFCD